MYGFHFLVHLTCVQGIRDTQCGFKLLTRAASSRLFTLMHIDRWYLHLKCSEPRDSAPPTPPGPLMLSCSTLHSGWACLSQKSPSTGRRLKVLAALVTWQPVCNCGNGRPPMQAQSWFLC